MRKKDASGKTRQWCTIRCAKCKKKVNIRVDARELGQKYCSRTCANRVTSRSLVVRQKISQSHIGMRPSKATRLKMRLSFFARKRKKMKMTAIERKMSQLLRKSKIKYEREVPLCNIAIVDFLIKDTNIIIECDGCRWHGCPTHYPEMSASRKKDRARDKVLKKAGYRLFRYWEHEIKFMTTLPNDIQCEIYGQEAESDC